MLLCPSTALGPMHRLQGAKRLTRQLSRSDLATALIVLAILAEGVGFYRHFADKVHADGSSFLAGYAAVMTAPALVFLTIAEASLITLAWCIRTMWTVDQTDRNPAETKLDATVRESTLRAYTKARRLLPVALLAIIGSMFVLTHLL
jgi:hypothetical protein